MHVQPKREDASASRRRDNRSRSQPPSKRVRARPVIPGATLLITRRCLERRLFLNPDAKVAEKLHNFIGYTLGVCLNRYHIQLHAAAYPGNHEHLTITDPLGTLPGFKDTLHAWLARGINAMRGRFGTFWSSDEPVDSQPGDPLFDDEEQTWRPGELDALVYTLTQVSKHKLLPNGSRYPGFTTYGWRFGETRTFTRPDWFYDANNPKLPDTVSITLHRPKDVRPGLSDDELFDELMTRVRATEISNKAKFRHEGKRFLGERKIAKQDWNKAPRSNEDRFTMAKRVRDRDAKRRVAALSRYRKWRGRYADARERQRAGEQGVVFPYGTYWLRRFAGVKVANAPP